MSTLTLRLQTRSVARAETLRSRLARALEPELERWTARAATATALGAIFDEPTAP
jgi:hypothetical protein